MPSGSATSDDILRCACALIISGGYNGFSYADIAEVVGIRKASIHHHFPTKLDLVHTLVQRYREGVDGGFAEFERSLPDPMDQLRAYIGHWESCIGDATAAFCVCALHAKRNSRAATGNRARAEAETLMATVHGAMLSARAYGDRSSESSPMPY